MIPVCAGCADELGIPRVHPKVGQPAVKHRLARCKVCEAMTWAGIKVESLPEGPKLDELSRRFGGLL